MNTKNMTKEQALKQIDILTKRIAFNNELNKFVRKFRKEHNVKAPYEKGKSVADGFNGYWDEPTSEMASAFVDIFVNDSLGDTSWMSDSLRDLYLKNCNHIFGQVYSPAVNSYILKDLHDLEDFVKVADNAADKASEENDVFKVERDLETNRINLYFDDIPSSEVRSVLKSNGFRWSSKFQCWTRQLTQEAEKSLNKIKNVLEIK